MEQEFGGEVRPSKTQRNQCNQIFLGTQGGVHVRLHNELAVFVDMLFFIKSCPLCRCCTVDINAAGFRYVVHLQKTIFTLQPTSIPSSPHLPQICEQISGLNISKQHLCGIYIHI